MALLDLLLADDVEGFNAARGRHSAPDLSVADLAGRRLAGADLARANLVNADLSGSDLSGAVLVQARLDGADLTGTDLRECLALRSRWRGAYLGEACLEAAALPQADLTEAELPGVRATGIDLSAARLRQADLQGAQLADAELGEANLSGAVLVGCKLAGARLVSANLSKADLSGADLSGADLSNARLPGVKATGASFKGAVLTGADLTGAVLDQADLSEANLTRADLGEASLRGAVLKGTLVREARLDGVDLEGADLAGAVMDAATLGEPPEEDGAQPERLLFEDLDGCVSEGAVGLLWENPDAPGRGRLRVAVAALGTPWDGRAPALPEPADLVVARALVPSVTGFSALLFVQRPGGLICRLTEVSALGDVGSTRTVPFDYVPAVRPAFFPAADGFRVAGLTRRGPGIVLQSFDGEGFQPVASGRLATARGFVGGLQPVVVCKGGVAIPVDPDGLGKAVSVPEGFPGRAATAGRCDGAVFVAWAPASEAGLRWALLQSGRPMQQGVLAADLGVGSLDCVGIGDKVLLAWTQEGETPAEPASLMGAWLPGGRPQVLVSGDEADLDEVAVMAGGAEPVITVVASDGSARVLRVTEAGPRMACHFAARRKPASQSSD